jgi:hydroxymethylbilane synthase
MQKISLSVGTRGSAMALAQTRMIMAMLKNSNKIDLDLSEKIIKTCGDIWQGTNKAEAVDKRKWMGALEEALVNGSADFAVHSAKDIPSEIHKSTALLSVAKRANPQDIFIGKLVDGQRKKLSSFEKNYPLLVGTASLRRQMQFMAEYPNSKLIAHRGNVPTRIQNLDSDPKLDGIIVAAAGLERLQTKDIEFEYLPKETLVPAVNQGILAVQFKKDNLELARILASITHAETQISFEVERYIVEALEGGCHSALGVYGAVLNNTLLVHVRIIGVLSRATINIEESLVVERWKSEADILIAKLKNLGATKLLSEGEEVLQPKKQCNGGMQHA